MLIEMAAAEDSYCRLLAEWHKHDDYDMMFRKTVRELSGNVDFSRIRSCVAFGTGSGEHEIAFVRHLLPNLRVFIAVEPDPGSIRALRENFRDGRLPRVETTVTETALEDWTGVDDAVDSALLFNVLFHVKPEDRRALFAQLAERHLNRDGVVVVVENESADASGFMRLMKRLGNPEYRYTDIEADTLAAGFSPVLTRTIAGWRDLSDPNDDVVKYVERLVPCSVSRDDIRAAIADIFSKPNLRNYNKRLAIFQK